MRRNWTAWRTFAFVCVNRSLPVVECVCGKLAEELVAKCFSFYYDAFVTGL